eukprot:CAMPEP_0117440238 /NCGR_PEP_ID=MMETSP0759-20121206/2980_1 /TAXON_ID=63605 /ORGANISM="Percolomonas cosmopolitus, Strain WS" /LENGTH=365 /DNA_ID=CAMNT_0005231983 /DNA_START=15 /DNA_END=1109 /DNA_ORIENTATION=-
MQPKRPCNRLLQQNAHFPLLFSSCPYVLSCVCRFSSKIDDSEVLNLSLSQKTELIQQFVKEHPGDEISIAQKRLLMEKTQFSHAKLTFYIRKFRDPNREITPEKKAALVSWLKANDFRNPTLKERRILREKVDLSSHQLKSQIRVLLDPKGRITRTKKEFLRNWYEENMPSAECNDSADCQVNTAGVFPTQVQLLYLSNHLRWSRRQVYNQIHRLKHPVRSLTSEEEERLCQWVHRYESTHGKKRISTFDKYSCLKEVFPHQDDRIPMEQLSHYISKSQRALEQTPITANGKKIIADWIHENKRQPSQQDKQLLQQQTGLDRKQLEHQIRGIVDVKGNVTADVKEMIKDWICQHNGQAPEGPERT